jgi:Domain of unknown function (DUF4259)
MAAWGSGSFENDDAHDWLDRLARLTLDDLKQLLSRADDNAYLEAPESSIMVAAAEAVAALQGRPAQGTPRAIVEWTSKTETVPLQDLAALAIRAVQRVRTDSELKDLWLEADGLNEWSAGLRDLEKRLAG